MIKIPLILIGVFAWACFLYGSIYLYVLADDPYALWRFAVRLLVVVPLATVLAVLSTRIFNRYTPANWLPETWENEIAKAIVLATLLFGSFWLCVQG